MSNWKYCIIENNLNLKKCVIDNLNNKSITKEIEEEKICCCQTNQPNEDNYQALGEAFFIFG